MRLLPFLLACFAAFAVCHYFWVPAIQRRLRINPSVANISQWALLSLAGFVRFYLLVATLTTASIIAVVVISGAMGGTSVANVNAVIETAQQLRAWLSGFGPWWGSGALIVLITALGSYAYRRGKQDVTASYARVYKRAKEQVEQDYKDGKWEDLPPTNEMARVQSQLLEADDAYRNLNQKAQSNPEAAELRQQMLDQIGLLTRRYHDLDIQRRLDIHIDPEEAELPQPRNWRERVHAFFMSRGLLNSLGYGSRLIFLLSIILLVPSLTGVYSIGVRKMLDDHLVNLNELRVRLELEEAKQQLGEEKEELSEEDKAMLLDFARIFESAPLDPELFNYFEDPFPPDSPGSSPPPPRSPSGSPHNSGPSTAKDWYSFRSTVVRNEVLSRASERTKTPWRKSTPGSQIAELSSLDRKVASAAENAVKTRGPLTEEGRRFHAGLTDVAKRSPAARGKLRVLLQNLRQEFQRPSNPYDIGSALLGYLLAEVANVESSEVGDAIRASGLKLSADGMRVMQHDRTRNFLFRLIASVNPGGEQGGAAGQTDLPGRANPKKPLSPNDRGPATGGNSSDLAEFQPVLQKARNVADKWPAEINAKGSNYPPSVDATPESQIDHDGAVRRINEFRKTSSTDVVSVESLSDSLASFEDYLPGQFGADGRTVRGHFLYGAGGDDKGPPGGGPGLLSGGSRGLGELSNQGVLARMDAAKAAFSRARNYASLQGFSRVGGVLIGRPPDDAATASPDFIDLEWEVENKTVRLILVSANGTRHRSRPHRMSLAYQALNYAADGRPLAVTMTTAAPLSELKILLHPTLIDTPLGHRTIELDRFVDHYTGRDKTRMEAESRIHAQFALYTVAWARRLLTLIDWLKSLAPGEGKLEQIRLIAEKMAMVPRLRDAARQALTDIGALSDSNRSPLMVKTQFFDQTLIESIKQAASPLPYEAEPALLSLESFEEDLASLATDELNSLPGVSLLRLRRGLNQFDYPDGYLQLYQDEILGRRRLSLPGDPDRTIPRIPDFLRESATTFNLTEAMAADVAKRWSAPPPIFQVWSGVRELSFKTDPAEFMALENKPPQMPLGFILQVAFASAPAFGGAGATERADALPWEFPLIRNDIRNKTLNGIRNAPHRRDQEILDDLSEFAILQRMFRMAFSGQLGLRFPVEKLIQLSDATAAGAPKTLTRTLRWNVTAGRRGGLYSLTDLNTEEKEFLRFGRELRSLLGLAKDDEQARTDQRASRLPSLDQ
jgi:hypothetical protein